MKAKKIINVVFYNYFNGNEEHREACIFYRDGSVKSTNYDGGLDACEEIVKERNITSTNVFKEMINKEIVHVMTAEEFKNRYESFVNHEVIDKEMIDEVIEESMPKTKVKEARPIAENIAENINSTAPATNAVNRLRAATSTDLGVEEDEDDYVFDDEDEDEDDYTYDDEYEEDDDDFIYGSDDDDIYYDNNEDEAVIRIKNKLTDRKEIINGICISAYELGLYRLDKNMTFSIYDAIVSMINIDTIKRLKDKIYFLNSNCDSDDKFIELLKTRLNISKIELLFNTNVSEIVSLYYNTSIDDIPRIDEVKVRNKIKLLNNKKYNSLIENTVIIFIARLVQELAKIRNVKNNDRDVFKYLVAITQIEILIDYLDKNKLQELYDFCIKMTNDENIASMNNIKKLVKNKMNNWWRYNG